MTREPRCRPIAIRSPRRGRVTEIDWADGHRGIYPHEVLRGYCPCAACQGHGGPIRWIETREDQRELENIETVGGYALSLSWSDGHSSGIYSYQFLRALCQCAACCSNEHRDLPRN
jgi:DUF971 family protein